MRKARGSQSGNGTKQVERHATAKPEEMPWADAWESAKAMFNYGRVDAACRGTLRYDGLRSAFLVFLAGALITAILTLAVSVETAYFKAFAYRTLAEAGMGTEPQINMDWTLPLGAFLLFFGVPFGMMLTFLYEAVAYQLIRISGGKGTFGQQYNLSSVVALSMALSSAVLFIAPVPCIGILAIAAYVGLMLYFTFFVRCKAYEAVHGISFLHAFVIVLLVTAATAAVAFVANSIVAGLFSSIAGGV